MRELTVVFIVFTPYLECVLACYREEESRDGGLMRGYGFRKVGVWVGKGGKVATLLTTKVGDLG